MRVVIRTLAEVLALGVLASVVAFGANSVRERGSLEVGRDYFPPIGDRRESPSTEVPQVKTVVPEKPADAAADANAAHRDFGFQTVSVDEVIDLFNDPRTEVKAYLFVDARNDEHYEDGHIPGAVQADHYELDRYIDSLLSQAEAAEKIIVYCNGGECEDSVFMCQDLEGLGIPHDNIFLFAGGWEAWTKRDLPVETGRSQ